MYEKFYIREFRKKSPSLYSNAVTMRWKSEFIRFLQVTSLWKLTEWPRNFGSKILFRTINYFEIIKYISIKVGTNWTHNMNWIWFRMSARWLWIIFANKRAILSSIKTISRRWKGFDIAYIIYDIWLNLCKCQG